MVDIYEENSASHKCVVGKRKIILIALSENLLFFDAVPSLDKWLFLKVAR